MKAKIASSSSEGGEPSPPEVVHDGGAEDTDGEASGSQPAPRPQWADNALKSAVKDVAQFKASFKKDLGATRKPPRYDPDYYKEAQKKLKKAVLEHYRYVLDRA
jgi:hypothetical protein